MDNLQQVDAWLAALLNRLEPAQRSRMLREVARDVRKIQQANITAQRAPDGTAWEPKRVTARTKKGRIRRKMFTKLKTAKYLKAQANANQAEVSFTGQVQRLARVHHYGLRDKVNRHGTEVKYAQRPLLGITDNAEAAIRDNLMRWLMS
ncbi:phage virion morphogenesis protein [Erwinia billingiae]|uniref:phage virion morphogenesis protein n=1 Tax=Erwinia billingiae TaxID=182337 RepID=UPI0019D0BD25|nr:phage virion morphogenesis protein [Erwinia billingiae]MBN7122425.1 phage virion morphogenesis protein [Erwinia billingiae]